VSEKRTPAEESKKRYGDLTEIVRLAIARNRGFVTQRAEQLKTRYARLSDIEKRFLLSLIDTERRLLLSILWVMSQFVRSNNCLSGQALSRFRALKYPR